MGSQAENLWALPLLTMLKELAGTQKGIRTCGKKEGCERSLMSGLQGAVGNLACPD